MSSAKRREAYQEQWERDQEAFRKEEARKAALSMSDRIYEVAASEDVKEILRRLANKLGVLYD